MLRMLKHVGGRREPVDCGTQPAIGGIAPAERFEMELEDPVLGRSMRCAYDIRALPLVS